MNLENQSNPHDASGESEKPRTEKPRKPRRFFTYALPVWLRLRITHSKDQLDTPDPHETRISSDVVDAVKEDLLEILGYDKVIDSIEILGDDLEADDPLSKQEQREATPEFVCTLPVLVRAQFTFSEDEVVDPDSDDPDIAESALESLSDELREQVEAKYEVESVDILDDALDSLFLGMSEA
jgi:hypothetical protein